MTDPELLKMLRCPETCLELRPADPTLVEELNGKIAKGALRNRGNQPVTEKMDGGLLRADGKVMFPVRKNIAVMLVDEAVPMTA